MTFRRRSRPFDYLRDEEREEDLGPFPGTVQGEYYVVREEEVERLAQAWNEPIAKVREQAAKDARAFACRERLYADIRVTAERAGVIGFDYLGWCDIWPRNGETVEGQIREIADWNGMADEAIDEASRNLLGGLAPLALSY